MKKAIHTIEVTYLKPTTFLGARYKVGSLLWKDCGASFRVPFNYSLDGLLRSTAQAKTAFILLFHRMGYVVDGVTDTDSGWEFTVRSIDRRGDSLWITPTKKHRKYWSEITPEQCDAITDPTQYPRDVDPEANPYCERGHNGIPLDRLRGDCQSS